MIRKFIFYVAVCLLPVAAFAQKVVPIYPAAAPGSADWNWQEGQTISKAWGNVPIVYNVVKPSLTIYAPAAGTANGTAMVVCPGGGFYALSIGKEGTQVAEALTKKGITVFVLKYRLIHSTTADPGQEFLNGLQDFPKMIALQAKVVPLAMADGKQALTYVRSHATEYHLDAKKIGVIGFSAGGTVAIATAFNYTAENRPDFMASIYGYLPPGVFGQPAADAPPLFVAAATDDQLKLVPSSLELYTKWLNSGHPAEMHIYAKGGHGFGMAKQNLPSDSWIDRFTDWLKFNKYIN